jgi:hypothetical protein
MEIQKNALWHQSKLIILATQETEIRGIAVWSQPGQIVLWDPILKNPSQKRAGGVAQGEGLEFKPQYWKKKKKKEKKKEREM